MKQIIVTGAKGQLGSEIHHLSDKYKQLEFTYLDKEDYDFSKLDKLESFLEDIQFDLIINCAAFTAVDAAEENQELSRILNTDLPKKLAEFCVKNNKRLFHISTDYVFNGEFNKPITESDIPDPLSVYGQTKLDGEKSVISILPNAYVFRTSWVFSGFGHNFVKSIIRLASEKDELKVIYDQIGTPTYARDLAKTILDIIENLHENDNPGIYNFTNEGVCSWYDLAHYILSKRKSNCSLAPILSSEYSSLARRPYYSILNKSKIKETFGITIDHWMKGIDEVLCEL